jgi:hypothetical protein
MGPFKAKYAAAQIDWMTVNPKKKGILDLTITIATAYPVSFIMQNVLVGLETFGICPVSRNAFSNEEFREECVGVRNPLL